MRALLDLLRENRAAAKTMLRRCLSLLKYARSHLKILSLEHGEEELIFSFGAELAKLIR